MANPWMSKFRIRSNGDDVCRVRRFSGSCIFISRCTVDWQVTLLLESATSSEDADSSADTYEDFTSWCEGGRWYGGTGSKCEYLLWKGHLLQERIFDEGRENYEDRLFRVVNQRYLEGGQRVPISGTKMRQCAIPLVRVKRPCHGLALFGDLPVYTNYNSQWVCMLIESVTCAKMKCLSN